MLGLFGKGHGGSDHGGKGGDWNVSKDDNSVNDSYNDHSVNDSYNDTDFLSGNSFLNGNSLLSGNETSLTLIGSKDGGGHGGGHGDWGNDYC